MTTITDRHDTTCDELAAGQALDGLRSAVAHIETAHVCLKFASDRAQRVKGLPFDESLMLGALGAALTPLREQVQISMDRLERAGAR